MFSFAFRESAIVQPLLFKNIYEYATCLFLYKILYVENTLKDLKYYYLNQFETFNRRKQNILGA